MFNTNCKDWQVRVKNDANVRNKLYKCIDCQQGRDVYRGMYDDTDILAVFEDQLRVEKNR